LVKMKSISEKRVAIIIITYNQKKLLIDCIKSIKENTDYGPYEIFVVDNGSKDGIGRKIHELFPDINVIINEKNFGFGRGNNVGLMVAEKAYNPDYFLILNDDTEIIQKDWLGKSIDFLERDKKTGILGAKLIYADGKVQNAGGFTKGWQITRLSEIRKDDFINVDHVMGAFMLIRKEAIRVTGGFDEIFSPYLLEDTDLCLRAKKKGFAVKSAGGVEVIHHAHKSLSQSRNPNLFFRFKNDILFSWRHLTFTNFIFRTFIYLPAVAIFKKENDESELKIKNFRLRKDFLFNLVYLIRAYIFILLGGRAINLE